MEEKGKLIVNEHGLPQEKLGEPFYPHHVLKQIIQFVLVIAILITLTTFSPAPMEPKANPFTTPEHIKPEWYFLAAYQFLKLAEKLDFIAPWAPKIVGVLGQGIAILLIILFPFIDRNKERHPLRRPIALSLAIIGVIVFLALTIWGKIS